MRGLLVDRQLADLQAGPGGRLGRADGELQLAAHVRQLADQVLPLAHAQPAEVFGLADAAQRVVARLAVRLEDPVPHVEGGEEVAGLVRIAVVDAVGRVARLVGALARVLQAQERHDHQHGGQRVGRGRLRGLNHHAAEPHVDRDARKLAAGVREHHLAALAGDGLQLGQLVEAVRDGLHVGRVDEAEVRHVLGGAGDPDRQHVQHHGAERGAQDLRLGESRARLVVLARVQADRDAVGDAAASAGPLVGAGLADRLDRQALHLRGLRIAGDAGGAGVDHVADTRHGQRRLGDVGRDHDALVRMRLEHAVLVLGRQPGEQRHDLDRVGAAHVLGARPVVVAQRVLELVDVALAGGEHEDVARPALVARMDDQLGAGARHRRRHVHIRVAAVAAAPGTVAAAVALGSGGRRGQLRVGLLAGHRAGLEAGHGAHQRGRGAERLVEDLHRIGAPRHLDDRHLRAERMLEVLLELHRVDRRRRDHELEVAAAGEQRGQVAEQEIDVEAALVRLVDDDRVVLAEFRIALDLREQDAVGDHAQPGLRRALVGEPHLIADLVAQAHAHFAGDAFGDRACGDAPRLRVHDLLAVRAAAELQQDLRQLRGLARAGLTGHDHDLAGTDGPRDVVARRRHRQFGWIIKSHK